MFIALCGPDFCGKTSQAELLTGRLVAAGHDTLHLSFPSKSPAGVAARALLMSTQPFGPVDQRAAIIQSCMAADRYSTAPAIRQQLSRGGLVVADRWSPSGLIYGRLDGLDPDWLEALHRDLPAPDLHILLWASFEDLQARAKMRGGFGKDRYENETMLRAVHAAYDCMWKARDSKAWVRVDASQAAEKVTVDILAIIARFICNRGF
jgi:thymidylate kinase